MTAENTDDLEKYLEEHAGELEEVDDSPFDEAKFKELLERMNAIVKDIDNDQAARDVLRRILLEGDANAEEEAS